MGRHSSDSECDSRSRRKKKHRRRSSSSSSADSRTSSRKRLGRKSRSKSRSWSRDHRTRSRSRDRRRRRRSSSDSSYESRKKRTSRSRSRDRGRSYRSRRSRSRSRTRRHRQRSHSRSSDRSARRRSHSWSRERDRRKGREKEKARDKERDKSKKEFHISKHGDSGNIKAGLEHLTPSAQAKAKVQIALKAVESLKAKEKCEEVVIKKEEDQFSLGEQIKRMRDIETIESDSFVQQEFRSSKDTKKLTETSEEKHDSAMLGTGTADLLNIDIKQEISEIPVMYQDDDTLAHPSLFIDKAEAEEQWFKRLITLRQERLMGSPVC